MRDRIIAISSWLIALWTSKVFITSLFYKFTDDPDTQYIFGTIGQWMNDTISESLGNWFTNYGAYTVGSMELLASFVLLSPALFFGFKSIGVTHKLFERSLLHCLGGLLAFSIMSGAVFFHLATPLGIEVLNGGQSDHGALFYTAISILISCLIMAVVNFKYWQSNKTG